MERGGSQLRHAAEHELAGIVSLAAGCANVTTKTKRSAFSTPLHFHRNLLGTHTHVVHALARVMAGTPAHKGSTQQAAGSRRGLGRKRVARLPSSPTEKHQHLAQEAVLVYRFLDSP